MSQVSDSAPDATSVVQDVSSDPPNTPVVSPVAHTEELAAADALISFRHQGASTPAEDQENVPPKGVNTESEAEGSVVRSEIAGRWYEPLARRRRIFRGNSPANRAREVMLKEALKMVRPEEMHRSRELTAEDEIKYAVELGLLDDTLLGEHSAIHPGSYLLDAAAHEALMDALEERREILNNALAVLGKRAVNLPAWGAEFKLDIAWPRPIFSRLAVLFREDVEVFLAHCSTPASISDADGPYRLTRRGRARQRRAATAALTAFITNWHGEPSTVLMAHPHPVPREDTPVPEASPSRVVRPTTPPTNESAPVHARSSAPHVSVPAFIRGVNREPLGVRNAPPHLQDDPGAAPVEDRMGLRGLRQELAEARAPLVPRPDDPDSPYVRLGRSRRLADAFRDPREGAPRIQDGMRRLSLNERLDENGDVSDEQDQADEEEVEAYLARPSQYWGNGGMRTSGRGGFGNRTSPRTPRDRGTIYPSTPGSGSSGSKIAEPHFDTKLKVEQIEEWDGNTETLLDWIESVNVLAARSDTTYRQLGELVPTRLRKGAREWWTSLSLSARRQAMTSWATLRSAIARYYMGKKWFDRQKLLAKQCRYRDSNSPNESPSEYFIRKFKLLETAEDYTESVMIMAIMDGAPHHWHSVIDTSTIATTAELQEKILFHEDTLRNGPTANEDANRQIMRRLRSLEEEMKAKGGWRKGNAHRTTSNLVTINDEDEELEVEAKLAGWSKELGPPKYPRDDATRSRGKTPEDKGARPCRHCGSPKHWDPDCKYARREVKRVRAHLASASEDYRLAQEEYDALYASDETEDPASSLN